MFDEEKERSNQDWPRKGGKFCARKNSPWVKFQYGTEITRTSDKFPLCEGVRIRLKWTATRLVFEAAMRTMSVHLKLCGGPTWSESIWPTFGPHSERK